MRRQTYWHETLPETIYKMDESIHNEKLKIENTTRERRMMNLQKLQMSSLVSPKIFSESVKPIFY